VIYGIPRSEDALSFCEHFTAIGARDMRVVEKVSGWGNSLILVPFDSTAAAHNFRELVNGSLAHGQQITAIPFVCEEHVVCEMSYPHLPAVLSQESCFDFRLIYYDQVFMCWSGSAIAISSLIADAAASDPNISQFFVPRIPGPFELLVDFFRGRQFQLNDRNCVFVHEMANALGIPQLSAKAKRFLFEVSDIESTIVILDELFSRNLDTSFHLPIVASELKNLASAPAIQAYPAELLELLISSPYSSFESEDVVYQFIEKFKDLMPAKFRHLIRQVRINSLTTPQLVKLLLDPAIDLNDFRIGLLHLRPQLNFRSEALRPETGSSRLTARNGACVFFSDLFVAQVIEMENGAYFSGVFAALKRRFGENLLAQDVIRLSASSSSHMTVAVLLDSEPSDYFGTSDEPNSWIMVEFRTMKLSLTGYSFRTHSHQGNGHIRGWVIEGLDDHHRWTTVDSRSDIDTFQALGWAAYFKLPDKSPYFHAFRIRQTQKKFIEL
jgi:hypothetical protein